MKREQAALLNNKTLADATDQQIVIAIEAWQLDDNQGYDEALELLCDIQTVLLARRRLAKLTPEENAAWDKAFEFHANALETDDAPETDELNSRIAELAWRDLQQQFPRLEAFDGCEP